MPAADSIVPTIAAVFAAIGGRELIGLAFSRRKTSAEAEAAAAGAIVSKADAAQTLNETAVALVKPLTEQISSLRHRVDELETRERNHAHLLEQHAVWDRGAARALAEAGIVVDVAPPLYPDAAGV